MKQILQSYRSGELVLADVPVPHVAPSTGVLVATRASLVSLGTEKAMMEIARKSLAGKVLARPDWRGQLLAKIRTDGVVEAYRQAMSRLEAPTPMGYSSAGVVLEVGARVTEHAVGDAVACAGSGYASHAEVVAVPRNLCVAIPSGVSYDEAAFVALGGIALEAVRVAHVELGHRIGVVGLGMLGQLAVQLLKAAGCHVLGMDPSPDRCALAEELGCDAAVASAQEMRSLVRGRWAFGCDAVILLAATLSNEPVELAAEICRERGRVVATGMVGLNIPRRAFYEKELELIVSRAWGPGMYDADFEERDVKYPPAYARWTAQSNMAEFLSQVRHGKVRMDRIITHRFPIEHALDAYAMIMKGTEPAMGVLLTYPERPIDRKAEVTIVAPTVRTTRSQSRGAGGPIKPVGIGLIGAGQFASGTLLPAIKGLPGLRYCGVATSSGRRGTHAMTKFNFDYATTDYQQILDDPDISLVFVLTRHGSHARLAADSLAAGKNTFVEKPLATNAEQLAHVLQTYAGAAEGGLASQTDWGPEMPMLMVGFNRRFSPTAQWLKQRFSTVYDPLAVHCTVNAGFTPADSWVHDAEQGGGRIIGEVCHFIDLVQYFTDALAVRVHAETIKAAGYLPSDNVAVTLQMSDGSIGSIVYVSGGDQSYARERVEIFGGGAVGIINNFKAAVFTHGGRKERMRQWLSIDRGHRAEVHELVTAIQEGGPPPVSMTEYVNTTLATLGIEDALRSGQATVLEARWASGAT